MDTAQENGYISQTIEARTFNPMSAQFKECVQLSTSAYWYDMVTYNVFYNKISTNFNSIFCYMG